MQYLSTIISIISLLIVALIVIISLTWKKNDEKKCRKFTLQQELLKTKVEIQEQTFQNISHEIHDNVGQMLSLAKWNLHITDFSDLQLATEKLERSKELVGQAIADLRSLSKSLNAEMIKEAGLNESIKREISLVSKTGQYETVFNQEGLPFRFDKQKELILFRIFQEALNNIFDHAGAKTVIVRLFYEPRLFNLTVSDDGEGFSPARLLTDQQFGLGIRNMQSRASIIGATFQLSSTPGKGTTVSIDLPLENNNGT